MCRHRNAEQSRDVKVANRSFENVVVQVYGNLSKRWKLIESKGRIGRVALHEWKREIACRT